MRKNKHIFFTSPKYIFFITLISIFLIEWLLMKSVWLIEYWGYSQQIVGLADSVVLIFLLNPVLYLFLIIPIKKYIRQIEVLNYQLKESNKELDHKIHERTEELIKLNRLLEQEYVEALALSEERYRNLVDNLSQGVSVISPDLKVQSVNSKVAKRYPNIDFSEKPKCFQVFSDPRRDNPCDNCPVQKVLQAGIVQETIKDTAINGVTNVWRCVYSPLKNQDGQIVAVVRLSENVTKQKQIEQALVDSEEKFRVILEAAKNAIVILDSFGLVQYWNPAAEALFGFAVTEVVGKELHPLVSTFNSAQQWDSLFEKFRQTGTGNVVGKTIELMAAHKDRTEFPIELSISTFQLGNQWHALGIVQDITERKRTEKGIVELNKTLQKMVGDRTEELEEAYRQLEGGMEELKKAKQLAIESRDFCLTLFDKFPALIWRSGTDAKCNYFNKTWLDFTGRTMEQEVGEGWTEGVYPDDLERCLAIYLDAFRTRTAFSMEYRLKRFDGSYRWILDRGSSFCDTHGNFAGYIGSCYDITDQKVAEESLTQSEEKYRSLIKQSTDGIFVFDLNTRRIQEANDQFLELLGYTEENIKEMKLEEIVFADFYSVERNVANLLKTGEIKIHRRKFERKDGCMVDVEVSASLIRFGDSQVGLVNVRDITERIRAEKNLQTNYQQLRRTLDETVNAFMILAEKRDPYTAGHQQRVARLAVVIAREMGLDESLVEGLEIAAKLHDIGKVYVPAEILNKPGILTDPEMSLIKIHPTIGQEILGKIPFDAPVGEIIAQHHERLNGSGYPKGLSEKEIRVEAKILAVADMVEAVASHRPYRAALGLGKAFEELEINQGILYDQKVVEACLKVFREQDPFSNGIGNLVS